MTFDELEKRVTILSDLVNELLDWKKGVDAKPARGGTRLPDNWKPLPSDRDFAKDLGLDPDLTADEFRDYWTALPGARGRKLDWSKTFRNRCRELAGRPKGRGATKPVLHTLPLDPTAGDWKGRVDWFRTKGMWNPNWGPNPDEPGCFAPKELLQ